MKTLTTIALLSLTLTLVACSDSTGPDSSTTDNTTSSMTEPAEPVVSGQGMEQGDQAAFEAGIDAANQTASEKQ
ncbi:MAG: hypothetical protein N0C81_12160 [Candidatus Thiodiazotropha lotti]|uniref:Secreted protein n=1 Tax=Candidatus Thiodiazotropha lotti TaxID=2792787 RepID=A0A9E4K3P8_9GAMM|nr:hypothetical protein [Candidatus Thiodiazotropha lotti]ODC00626.1 hypothetical protein A3197_09925 [Candidatus Thiodiazotropha endoloripes]MCG7920192.1 hypothetical protein [Candidatus Thiodiazotropha lotti]MCG7938190.1 hypothetical protein [Candidatus Thiodiazotropha lotti]MCG7985994.1 hypothetical protein [Candidatus Thiodiazotropha lotti]